ncbi:MAG: acyl-CoA/acyl-ACP dehydrogenase [Deltaproteobacteria bacterium]|nr:acyl-CoA/acyl-ACP dehydrogenase [Deltaproteobacteria bacterium]
MDIQLLRQELNKLLREKLEPVVELSDLNSEFPLEVYKEVARAGFGGVYLPEEYGGGGSLEGLMAVMEEMSKFSPGFALSAMASFQLFGYNIARLGTKDQKEKYLRGLMNEAKVGCWALTEPDVGSDAIHIKTTAKKEGNNYVLNGSKTFITNAPIADYFIIIANSGGGATGGGTGFNSGSAFVLEKGMKGLSVGKPFLKHGHRCSPTGQIFLDQVKVSKDCFLGSEGSAFADMKHSLELERFLVGPMVCGMLETLIEKSVAYAYGRQQFGQPILSFQLIQEKIARMRMHLEMIRSAVERGVALMEAGKSATNLATALKLYAGRAAVEMASESMQIHGGNGYMHEYRVEMFMRDAKLLEIGGGTNEMMIQILAKNTAKEIGKKSGLGTL